MINLAAIDKQIMRAMKGLDVFDAIFYGDGDPVECTVTRDTLELAGEFGLQVVSSAARVGYLVSEVANPKIGDYFEFAGQRYVIENKEPSQDSSWRFVHCRVGPIPGQPDD